MSLEFFPMASSSAGCSYRLSGGGASAPLLIDCGLRFDEIQQALDFKLGELAGCLVSHAHGDHVKAARELMGAGVDCYASLETWLAAKQVDPTHYRACVLGSKVQKQIGDWQVLPFEVVHDCPGTLGFVIGSPDGSKALYLTDTQFSPFRFEGLTHMYVECNFDEAIIKANARGGVIDGARFNRTVMTHMSLKRLLEMLEANDISKVEEIWLLHLSSANSDEKAFADAVRKATGVPVYVAAERTVTA